MPAGCPSRWPSVPATFSSKSSSCRTRWWRRACRSCGSATVRWPSRLARRVSRSRACCNPLGFFFPLCSRALRRPLPARGLELTRSHVVVCPWTCRFLPPSFCLPPLRWPSYRVGQRRDPNPERQEAKKLAYELRTVRRGATRELRRDAAFLSRVKRDEVIKSDREYKEKIKSIYSSVRALCRLLPGSSPPFSLHPR